MLALFIHIFFNLTAFLDSLPLQFAYYLFAQIEIYIYTCCKSMIVACACGDGVVPACVSGCIKQSNNHSNNQSINQCSKNSNQMNKIDADERRE